MLENIFVVGPEVTGMSFFGRIKEISDLETIFSSVAAIHLVGPTRIGKSSLVTRVFEKNRDYPNRLCVKLSMGECSSAYDFWKTLSLQLQEQIIEAELWDNLFERFYKRIAEVPSNSADWFTDFKLPLQSILKHIKERQYRLVLAIDEFDSVDKVFEQASHYFQVLRSIYSNPDYATSGVIVSRKRLHLIEAKCEDISTYHGVFREMTLLPFNAKDLQGVFEALAMYDIALSPNGKKKFEHYTGRMPYLCCMFAERMVSNQQHDGLLDDTEVDDIFKNCLPQITQHYRDLFDRLEYDGHLETMFYLAFTSRFPSSITKRDVETLVTMGTLITEEKRENVSYVCHSKDFMTWFRLQPLKLPAWETMTQSEKKIKAIFKKEFPEISEISYVDLTVSNDAIQDLNTRYPELGLNSGKIKRYCEDLAAHKEHPTVLDVLTLSEIVNVIVNTWATRFHKYFSGDDSWKVKLEHIKRIRNPIAHAAIEYVSQEDLASCMQYCDEIIHLKY